MTQITFNASTTIASIYKFKVCLKYKIHISILAIILLRSILQNCLVVFFDFVKARSYRIGLLLIRFKKVMIILELSYIYRSNLFDFLLTFI